MLRLFFPRIDFSGRMSRTHFWRELAVAAVTAPIVLAILAYLVNEFSVAGAQGLAVDDGRSKALAGAALTFISIRNTIAFWSIVKRRMNDIGCHTGDIGKMLIALGASVFIAIVAGPIMGPYASILLVPVFLLLFGRFARFLWRLMVWPSCDSPAARESSTGDRNETAPVGRLDLQLAPWLDQAETGGPFSRGWSTIKAEIVKLSQNPNARQIWREVKLATEGQRGARFEALKQWLERSVFDPEAGKRAGQSEGSRGGRPVTSTEVYRSPRTRVVRVARPVPRIGRSSLLGGFLRGPWG